MAERNQETHLLVQQAALISDTTSYTFAKHLVRQQSVTDQTMSEKSKSVKSTIDMEEVDLGNYMEDAQPYIHKAING